MLKSPKKMQKKKRLYIGKKKVPRWAEDIQQNDENVDAKVIFGECKVENLDTNIIFKVFGDEEIERTSSAKWNPSLFKV